MRLFGLIGRKLGHSQSKTWFANYFDTHQINADYQLFELSAITELNDLICRYPELKGLNVTVPFKKEVLPYCHELSSEVRKIGAANCISITEGYLKAYNTDVDGFAHLLSQVRAIRDIIPGALILGTGGAAAAAAYVFEQKGVPFIKVSRKPETGTGNIPYAALTAKLFELYPLIVNATPVGMHPEVNSLPPIPYQQLTGREILIDMIYNPEETRFLSEGRKRGCFTLNGKAMLHHQALRSWEIWNQH